jgi:hypothetical protein
LKPNIDLGATTTGKYGYRAGVQMEYEKRRLRLRMQSKLVSRRGVLAGVRDDENVEGPADRCELVAAPEAQLEARGVLQDDRRVRQVRTNETIARITRSRRDRYVLNWNACARITTGLAYLKAFRRLVSSGGNVSSNQESKILPLTNP